MIAETTAHMVAQSRGKLEGVSGLYHLTAAGQTSWHGFTAAILENRARRSGTASPRLSPIPTSAYPLPAPRPHYSVMSNDKLRDTFGAAIPAWEIGLDLCMAEM
jgi:dTDP-4-dehydrorhamnose reductase